MCVEIANRSKRRQAAAIFFVQKKRKKTTHTFASSSLPPSPFPLPCPHTQFYYEIRSSSLSSAFLATLCNILHSIGIIIYSTSSDVWWLEFVFALLVVFLLFNHACGHLMEHSLWYTPQFWRK